MKRPLVALVILATLAAAGRANAVLVIDTASSWDGNRTVGPFGELNSATYGQTFLVTDPETVLDDFTYFIDDRPTVDAPDVVTFSAYVAAWDGLRATGPMLFTSDPMSTSNIDGFEQFTVDTGGVALTAGQQYVAFFSVSNHFNDVLGQSIWGLTTNSYADGNFVFMNNADDFGELTTRDWNPKNSYDLAFTMSFSEPIPEPATVVIWSLLATMAVAAGRYRRRKNA